MSPKSGYSHKSGPVRSWMRAAFCYFGNDMKENGHDPLLLQARKLRREMTPQERKLWYCFLKTYPVKIYKQKIIDSFIVDFYCHAARLVIEVDGPVHDGRQATAHDDERSAVLAGRGLKVIRFTNAAVDWGFQAVCETIDREIQQRL